MDEETARRARLAFKSYVRDTVSHNMWKGIVSAMCDLETQLAETHQAVVVLKELCLRFVGGEKYAYSPENGEAWDPDLTLLSTLEVISALIIQARDALAAEKED